MTTRLMHYLDSGYRVLNYSKIFLTKEKAPLETGVHLNFDLNDGCNINCIMCCRKNNFKQQNFVPFEKFRSNIAHIFAHIDYFQCGCQFEPLMYPYFEEAVQTISQHLRPNIKGSLICNGTLLDQSKRKILIDSGVFKKVRISFDGATKPTFETIRRGAKFDRVIANISALVAEKSRARIEMDIAFNITIMQKNIAELPDLIKLAADLGLNGVTTHKLFPHDYGIIEKSYHNKLLENMKKAAQLASELDIQFSEQVYDNEKSANIFGCAKEKTCGFMEEPLLLILSSDGKLCTPCRQVPFPLGNLLQESFASIKDSRPFRLLSNCFASTCDRICNSCYMYRN